MLEEEKIDFLEKFKNNNNFFVFCVLGGMFLEGIDFLGD